MNLDDTKTVRELALNVAAATQVFEKLGIDYCCGGSRSLQHACSESNLAVQPVLECLNSAADSAEHGNTAGEQRGGWQTAPLADLIAHITNMHHKYVKAEIGRLRPLFDRVCNVHPARYPELLRLRVDF